MAKHTGILKLSNGRFRARYFAGYDAKTGKRVYPAKTFDTERHAREWRAEQIAIRGGRILQGRGVSVEEYLKHWIHTKQGIRDITRHTYEQIIKNYLCPMLGKVKLNRLQETNIEQWQKDLGERLSPSTLTIARVILFGALKSAKRKRLIASNPVENTDGPAKKGQVKPKAYPLTVEQAQMIVLLSDASPYGLAFKLIAVCGLRPEEVIGLRWRDLDLAGARGRLEVKQVIQHVPGGKWRCEEPKSPHSERIVVFPRTLVVKLGEHRKAQLEDKLKAGAHWRDHDLVFTKPNGEPLRYSQLSYRFKKMIVCGGLPKEITMYDLRHFFVTSSLMAEVDPKTVSREAGHRQVSFTLQRYGHVLPEMHDAACDKREQLLKAKR